MLGNFVSTWKSVIIHPNDFFRDMPTSGGYRDPLVFAVINYIIYAIIASTSNLVQIRSLVESGVIPGSMVAISYVMSLVGLIFTPVFSIIGLFIGAAIYFICFKMVGGSGSYEGTFRISAYASAVTVISGVLVVVFTFVNLLSPVNQMISITDMAELMESMQYMVYSISSIILLLLLLVIYSIYLMGQGGKYVHNITMLRSVIAILLPSIVVGLLFISLIMFSGSGGEICT